jgi:hypothetical protein
LFDGKADGLADGVGEALVVGDGDGCGEDAGSDGIAADPDLPELPGDVFAPLPVPFRS